MKLSKNTLSLIKNFSTINTNLLIQPGNLIRTISPSRHIYAEATIEETFTNQFGIYDLSELLSVISIFDSPELNFESNALYIEEGKNKVRYLASETSILIAPDKSLKMPPECAESFLLSAANLQQVTRAASVLKVPNISMIGSDGKLSLVATDITNPNTNQFAIDIGTTELVDFNVVVDVSLLKLMPEDYEVQIYPTKSAVKFVGTDKTYVIAWDKNATTFPT